MNKFMERVKGDIIKDFISFSRKFQCVKDFINSGCDDKNVELVIDLWIEKMENEYQEHLNTESSFWWDTYNCYCRSDYEKEINRRIEKLKNAKTYKEKADFLLRYGK